MDYWKVVGPLVTGDYSGMCVGLPSGAKVDIIKVGASGKASANGLEIDVHEAVQTTLTRQRDDKGQFSTTALLTVDGSKGGTLMLKSDAGGKGTVSLNRDDGSVTCTDVPGLDKLHAQPLYVALAGLQLAAKQTVTCARIKNLLSRHDTELTFADGVLKLGDEPYAVKDAISESIAFDEAGRTVSLSILVPGSKTFTMTYDGTGKFNGLGTMGPDGAGACEVKQ
jgi:hypothetical protein